MGARIFTIFGSFEGNNRRVISGELVEQPGGETRGYFFETDAYGYRSKRFVSGYFAKNNLSGKVGFAFFALSNEFEPMQGLVLDIEEGRPGYWSRQDPLRGGFERAGEMVLKFKEQEFTVEDSHRIERSCARILPGQTARAFSLPPFELSESENIPNPQTADGAKTIALTTITLTALATVYSKRLLRR